MSIVVFLVVAFGAAGIAFVGRGRPTFAITVGLIGLAASIVAAIAIDPTAVLDVGGSTLAASEYARLFLILGSVVGLILALVGLAAGSRPDAPAVTAGTIGAAGLALFLPDPLIAILASTAGGLLGVLLTLVPGSGRAGATIGIREIRALIVAGAMATAAAAWIGRDLSELVAQPVVFGLAYLAFGLAVAIRFGSIPFHVWAARLTDTVPESALPIVTAWGPAAFAVVALAWTDSSVAPLLVEMDAERAVILAIAIASITLAALAALVQDDIEHIVGYSIIGDASVVLLAIAALEPETWAPARTWILAYVVARSAFAAWAAAMRATFFTGRVADLGGWAVRAPLLGVSFGLIVFASIGLPGLAAFDARIELVDAAFEGPLRILVIVATFAPLLYYGRLLAVGVIRPEPSRDGTPGRMLGLPTAFRVDLNDLRGSATAGWAANRRAAVVAMSIVIAVLAVIVAAGGFGGPEAAAGLPPGPEGPSEPFETPPQGPVEESPPAETDAPTETSPTVESPSPAGSASASPTGSPSPPESPSPAGSPSASPSS